MGCKYVILLFILSLLRVEAGDKALEPGPSYIYDQIYTNLGSPSPCVRVLDKDDAYGCSTTQGGAVGSLYLVEAKEDLTSLSNAGTLSSWIDPKVVLLSASMFTRDNIHTLASMKGIAGVLVLTMYGANATRPDNLECSSPGEPYPNKKWGLYPTSEHVWNECGNSWNLEEQPFPIFALGDEDSEFFLAKALENKAKGYSWPKWSAELNAFMWASENSETCLRRGHCDPMGGQSVWSGMEDTISSEKKIVIAMTQADTNAFFHDLATGGEAHSSSIAALLTAAQALANWRVNRTVYDPATHKITPPTFVKELIFGFWTGEAWGYLGSRKFLWDIQNFKCDKLVNNDYCQSPFKFTMAFKNISLDRIDAIVELDQVGMIELTSPKVYVHREGPPERTASLWETLHGLATSSGIDVEQAEPLTPKSELPPSSLHSFLRASRSIPGVVLADYQTKYKNKFYHGEWDNAVNAGMNTKYEGVCKVANLVARTLWKLSMDDAQVPDDLVADCDVASMYMDCLAHNNTCEYKRQLLGLRGGPSVPTHYTGIFRRRLGEITLTQKFLYEALSVITSKQNYLAKNETFITRCNKSSECPQNQNMQCQLGVCRNATTYYHDAVSTGLEWQPDSLGLGTGTWVITNSSEPLYTEARWDTPGVRVFLTDNYVVECVVLFAGVVEFFVFLVIFWYIRMYMKKK